MRIHSDKLVPGDFYEAAQGIEGVWVDECEMTGSRSRANGFTVKLAAMPKEGRRRRRNTGTHGAEDGGWPIMVAAATYDEHGEWMAKLFDIDPDAIITYYNGRADFHEQTEGKYRTEVVV